MADPPSLAGAGREHQPVLSRRRRRRAQEGQVLIMALVFIAFFGLITAAVLQLADTVELQQSHGQSAANAGAGAEGGMLFAAEAASQQGSCSAPTITGPITMAGTHDTASFTTTGCNPGTTANLLADQCAVCVLGPAGLLSVDGSLTVLGPIAVNGNISSTGPTVSHVQPSTKLRPGFITCSESCSGDLDPPARQLTPGPSPAVSALTFPLDCNSSLDYTSGYQTVPSGCYTSVTLNCSQTFPVSACPYSLDLPITVVGRFTIGTGSGPMTTVTTTRDGSGVLAFTQDGSLVINSDGNLTLQGSFRNGDVALYVDPSDTYGPMDVIKVVGGALSVSGTVDAPAASVNVFGSSGTGIRGTLDVGPNGTDAESGRLIVGSLSIGPLGEATVTAVPPDPGYCWVYSDSVTVTTRGENDSGQTVVESNCSGEAGTRIISIDYTS
jgi:hypothetical protein